MGGAIASDVVLRGLGGDLDDLEALYKDIHRHPELSLQEERTGSPGRRAAQGCGL
jgi:metal-dependent amidase/aminoacylase/carboxypeptidase family protein